MKSIASSSYRYETTSIKQTAKRFMARTKLLIPIRSIERESTHMVITRAMFYFYQILTITRLDKSALKSYIKQEES